MLDFADFILDEGKTDALLLLLEDVKSPDTFQRVAEKALRAGKPLIVNKIGQSEAGVRGGGLAHGGAGRRLRRLPGDVPALRADRGPRSSARWSTSPRASSPGARACRRATASASARPRAAAAAGWRMPAPRPASRCPSSTRRRARRIDEHLPAYGTSQNPVDATAQAIFKLGYAGLAGLVAPSPMIDGIIVVMTARSSAQPRAPARGADPPGGGRPRSRS